MKLFLDTNVLIDFILERQPFYQAAAMIISYAEENRVQICVSSLSLVTTNFICIERCKMPIEIFRNKKNLWKSVPLITRTYTTPTTLCGKILRTEYNITLQKGLMPIIS